MELIKKEYPKISIVTPCFNSEEYLESTIESVLNQKYPNLEYIIIDGGSTDATIDIIKKYSEHLTYWISEKDNGMYEAIQKGFEKSTGELMAWIGSDDMYHSKSFFTVAEIFSRFKNIKWLLGANTLFDEFNRTIEISKSRKFNRYDLLNGDFKWIQQESCFWHRDLWDKIGSKLNTSLRLAGDFDLWVKFSRFEELHITNALIGGFRIRSSNQLSLEGMDAYLQEAEKIIYLEKTTYNENKKCRQYLFFQKMRTIPILKKLISFPKKFGVNRNVVCFDRANQQFKY